MPRAARCKTVDWDWDEFLEDRRVQAMSAEELGLWVRTLGALARAEEPGHLDGGVATLERASRAAGREWRRSGAATVAGLERTETGWRHARTERDHAEQSARIRAVRIQRAGAVTERWRRQREKDTARIGPVSAAVYGSEPPRTTVVIPPSLRHSVTPAKKRTECSERFASEPPPSPLSLQALSGEWWTPTDAEAADWRLAYPGVDLAQAAAAMRAWLAANKSRRKTLRGLPRFAATWLAKEQDRPHTNGEKPATLGDNGLPIDGSDGWGTPATWRR